MVAGSASVQEDAVGVSPLRVMVVIAFRIFAYGRSNSFFASSLLFLVDDGVAAAVENAKNECFLVRRDVLEDRLQCVVLHLAGRGAGDAVCRLFHRAVPCVVHLDQGFKAVFKIV